MPNGQRAKTWRLLNADGTFNIERSERRDFRGRDLYHSLLSVGIVRFLGWLFVFYVAVNLIFACGYFLAGPGALEGIGPQQGFSRFLSCFFFSVQTFATIGYGKLTPSGLAANFLVTLEALVGLLSVALATGIVFSRFSRPTARVVFSRVALITHHDGVPSFVFRIANARMNQIAEARVNVVLSRNEVTVEGERYRNLYDLRLERRDSPIFALSWTVVHPIERESPLFGMSESDLADSETEIIVTVNGTDDVFAQTIHARYSYVGADIVWGGNFKDMLHRQDGKIHLDLPAIHQLKEESSNA